MKQKHYITIGYFAVSILATAMACVAILTDLGQEYPLIFLGIAMV